MVCLLLLKTDTKYLFKKIKKGMHLPIKVKMSWWKWFNLSACFHVTCYFPSRMVTYQGLTESFAVSYDQLSLVEWKLLFLLNSCIISSLLSSRYSNESIKQGKRVAGKADYWHSQKRLSWSSYNREIPLWFILMCASLGNKQPQFALSQTYLSSNFQSCSFQVLDQLSNC